MMRTKLIKLKRNSGKTGKRHSLVLGVLSIAVLVAFVFRTFPSEVAQMIGVDAGMFKKYSDHVIGFGIAGIFLYLGGAMILHPVIGITLGMVGLVVAYFEYKKL